MHMRWYYCRRYYSYDYYSKWNRAISEYDHRAGIKRNYESSYRAIPKK